MSDFKDPPAFTSGDKDNLPGLITKLTQLRAVIQRIIGTSGPNQGLTAWEADGAGGGGSGGTTIVGGGGGGSGGGGPVDLTPPPTPTGFAAGAAISNIFISCDNQTYTVGGGHLYSRVYGATYDPVAGGALPTFSNAVLIDTFPGTIEAIPENPATEWHLWLTWVTHAGVESAAPAGGTNGKVATTGQDVTKLIEALTGEITASQLDVALSTRINLIDGPAGTAGSVNARIATEASTRTSADSALASNITTLYAQVGNNATAISNESTARANADGTLFAQYTVKIDTNGYVSGFGLASTSTGATPTSSFIVRADDFAIGSPSGPGITPTVPFIVRTTATTINGVSVPAGIYMTDTYIQNGTITNAKIGNAQIDDLKVANVSAAKLTAGQLQVGAYIRSTSYVAGSAGWTIEANGNAEFAAASIRGQLLAAQIGAGQIDASKINVTSLSAVSATMGLVRTASSGQRVEFSSTGVRVWDSANVLRIKLGDLS